MAIHMLLEEIGQPYERHLLRFSQDDQKKPDYLAVNPKGKVPALLTEDGVITEMPTISLYLGQRFPEAGLLPVGPVGPIRALEMLDYIAATIHMRGFSRLANPGNFSSDGDPELVIKTGRRMIDDGLSIMEDRLGGREFAVGDKFSIADAGYFLIEWWAGRRQVTLPSGLAAHYQRMLARPAVQRMLADEDAHR